MADVPAEQAPAAGPTIDIPDSKQGGASEATGEAWTSKYMGMEAPADEDNRPKSPSYYSFTASFMSGRHLLADGLSWDPPRPRPSVSERVAAGTARLRSENRQRDREQQEKIQAAIAKAHSRPSGCPPIRPKSEEPESIESRAARRRSELRQKTLEHHQQVLQLSEKIRHREPLYRTEEIGAPPGRLEQLVAERRRNLAEETRQREQALRNTAQFGRSKSLLVGSSRVPSVPPGRRSSEVALEKKREAKAVAREQWEKIQKMRESGYRRSAETFFPLFRKGRGADAGL